MKSILQFSVLLLLFISVSATSVSAQGFEQRRQAYITQALSNFNDNAITIQAYQGVPVNSAALDTLVAGVPVRGNVDFDLVKLVRILILGNGTYDSTIFPSINALPYWLTKGDTMHGYWSENHMIMWMSSDWLLHEYYNRGIDASLRNRIIHYLNLKNRYGFYEFFSPTYAPYCLSGLLNLADFAQDTEIKNLAIAASQRLLKDLMMLTNDKGVFFPVAGRSYYGKYEQAYGQNHSSLIWLLTGFGTMPTGASHSGGMLASTTVPLDDVINSWTPNLDTLYKIGHSLDTALVIHATQAHVDERMFHWSSGGYFHPLLAEQTAQLLVDSNFWNHVDFAAFQQLSGIAPSAFPGLADLMSSASKSTLICGQDVAIFKNQSVTLSSIHDFWKGKLGYQQFPVVANVGTTAVLTASGKIKKNWSQRNSNNANENLPYVEQNKNIALIMYRPEIIPSSLNLHNPEVALHFRDQDFDEVRNDSLWILGRNADAYVAVRRPCIGMIDSVRACPMKNAQSWVIIVGNATMYGSFDQFHNIVSQAVFSDSWSADSSSSPTQWIYSASINVDGKNISYDWYNERVPSFVSVPENLLSGNSPLLVYPNPAGDILNVRLNELTSTTLTLNLYDIYGRLVYSGIKAYQAGTDISLPLDELASGIYRLNVISASQSYSVKWIKR